MSRGKKGEKTVTGVFDSIFNQADFVNAAEVASVVELPLDSLSVNPYQPRKHFGPEELSQLASSIAAHGILQPVVVRQIGMGSYEIVAGERRFRAAKLAQLETIPAIVRDLDDQATHLLALVENLQRTDLNPLEETDALLRLLSVMLQKPVEDVADTLTALNDEARGRARHSAVSTEDRASVERLFQELGRFTVRSFVTHRLPLLNLPDDLLEVVRDGRLDYTKATAVARLKDEQTRTSLVQKIMEENLSLREVQLLVTTSNTGNRDKNGNAVMHELTHQYATLGKRLKRSPALRDEKKRQRIQKLLDQLEKLLA
jgi:ParB family chromosome partitioning protein